jgi:hypothetical protein
MEDENALPMYRWKEKMVEHLCVSERKKICVDVWEKKIRRGVSVTMGRENIMLSIC